ncbi:hypothetical protein [Imhoffiella purpurea]|uniref:Uncharacterized protein n=1 Tax=Imhoffiella purpurea TaxID=1249627 RepID=W9V703_9GAMM|nr:hypothetical protein [Imhoffiella purpurea]EXJ15194.1 hypothetical protein D779_1492 [Imhoffiella purpurea]
MNQTLQKLRELAQESALTAQDSDVKTRRKYESCAQIAAPLIRAFKDVENEFVRISILKQIWPRDYHRRDDRVRVLLVGMLGPREAPYGLKLAVPQGYLRFEVTLKPDGSPVFTCVRDTDGQRPMSMDFPDGDRWLEFFYKSIADLVEL